MSRSSEYECGACCVSAEAVADDPVFVIESVLARFGRDAAVRLYEQWYKTVPAIGGENAPLWNIAADIKTRLGIG